MSAQGPKKYQLTHKNSIIVLLVDKLLLGSSPQHIDA